MILQIIIILQVQGCDLYSDKSLIRGNYKNVLHFLEGSIISSRKQNNFAGGFDNSAILRDSIYDITGYIGFTQCVLGKSLEIRLLQVFELNTFTFWLWDGDVRTYNIVVYIQYEDIEKIILDTLSIKSKVTLHFPDQLIQSFRIYNRGGNTSNNNLHIIKAEAYYQI